MSFPGPLRRPSMHAERADVLWRAAPSAPLASWIVIQGVDRDFPRPAATTFRLRGSRVLRAAATVLPAPRSRRTSHTPPAVLQLRAGRAGPRRTGFLRTKPAVSKPPFFSERTAARLAS